MNKIKLYDEFKRNSMIKAAGFYFVFHWTGSKTAKSTINYLKNRLNGKGTVGYNLIIDTDGTRYYLAPPYRYFHNTGLGDNFDKNTYSIAFTGDNAKDILKNKEMILSAKQEISEMRDMFFSVTPTVFLNIEYFCHRELNKNKPDFPEGEWKKLKKLLDI